MKHMGWRKGVNNMYHTTRNAIGKKLEVGIRSTDKMMSILLSPIINTNVSFHAVKNISLNFIEKQNVLYS